MYTIHDLGTCLSPGTVSCVVQLAAADKQALQEKLAFAEFHISKLRQGNVKLAQDTCTAAEVMPCPCMT